jgi:hypothetical protein
VGSLAGISVGRNNKHGSMPRFTCCRSGITGNSRLIFSHCGHNRLPDKKIRPGFNWNLTPIPYLFRIDMQAERQIIGFVHS